MILNVFLFFFLSLSLSLFPSSYLLPSGDLEGTPLLYWIFSSSLQCCCCFRPVAASVKTPTPKRPPFLQTPSKVSPLGQVRTPSPLRKSRAYRPRYDMPLAHTVVASPLRSSASQ